MNRIAVSFFILSSLVLASCWLGFGNTARAAPSTITVPGDYPAIQQAINSALDGDTILVQSGTYSENIIINKTLSLIGESMETTIITAANSSINAVTIISDSVYFSGFTVTGATADYPSAFGVSVESVNNVTISNNNVTGNMYGIVLSISDNCTVGNNTVSSNYWGIDLNVADQYNTITDNTVISNEYYGIILWSSSRYNLVANNDLRNNGRGITLGYADLNVIESNYISNNTVGIEIQQVSNNNTVYHNNFVDNAGQAGGGQFSYSTNTWDNGYPEGGNYWNDLQAEDMFSGPDQNETGSDGICDETYGVNALPETLPELIQYDNYPLAGMFRIFNISWVDSGYIVESICNSTITNFDVYISIEHPDDPNARIMQFNVTGEDGTFGFCRLDFPTALLNGSYKVSVNGTEVPSRLLSYSNSTSSYLYFNYSHSTEEVIVIPESPSLLISAFAFLIAFTAAQLYIRKRRSNEEA